MGIFDDFYKKWWRNTDSRKQITEYLENSSIEDLGAVGNIDDALASLESLVEKSKSLGENGTQVLKDATDSYLSILVYNKAFDVSPVISELRGMLKKTGVVLSCKNMASYAQHVCDFAKALDTLGISTKEEVLDTLAALKMQIVLFGLNLSAIQSKLVPAVSAELASDIKILGNSIKRGFVAHEVDNQLNGL